MKKRFLHFFEIGSYLFVLFLISTLMIPAFQIDNDSMDGIMVFDEMNSFASIQKNVIFRLTFEEETKEYTIDDLKQFDSITGTGGRLKVTGDVSGPYEYNGVSIQTLIDEFTDVPGEYELVTISEDGYLFSFTHEQVTGQVMVYDMDGNECGMGGVQMILAYEENGEPLVHGGPLRIAWVNENDAITDAFLWPKFVVHIEIIADPEDSTPPSLVLQHPTDGIYVFDRKIISYRIPFIIGPITIIADASDQESGINQVMIIINENVKATMDIPSYQWEWDEYVFGTYSISITCYNGAGMIASEEIDVTIFNFF